MAPWHAIRPQPLIDKSTIGSIGLVFVRFRADTLTGDKVSGTMIHDGAAPKLLIRAGGNVARNIYSEPGPTSETKAVIVGGKGFVSGKESQLSGLFEVVETKPLTLKPFDVEPYK